MTLSNFVATYFASPTLLRVARVAKVGGLVRHLDGVKGIQSLLIALEKSRMVLVRIFFLTFVFLSIFAISGMNLFMHVKINKELNYLGISFETFGHTFNTLLRVSSTEKNRT